MTETAVVEKPKRKHVKRDAATITRCLIALVAANGNGDLASRTLAKDDIKIDPSLLYRWRNKIHRDEYMRLREEILPRIREEQADAHRALEVRQLALSNQAAELIAQRLPNMEDKNKINAMGKADIGSGIHAEKAQLLDDMPTQIVQRDATEVLRKLKSRGVVIDAEVIEETTLSAG